MPLRYIWYFIRKVYKKEPYHTYLILQTANLHARAGVASKSYPANMINIVKIKYRYDIKGLSYQPRNI